MDNFIYEKWSIYELHLVGEGFKTRYKSLKSLMSVNELETWR